MKSIAIKSTQARLSLLIGVLVVAAALNAVLAITQAAYFQQQLANLQAISAGIDEHDAARVSLLKQQIAYKNAILSNGEDARKDRADIDRYFAQLNEYAYQHRNALSEANARVDMDASFDGYDETTLNLWNVLFGENSDGVDPVAVSQNDVDPAADGLEDGILQLTASDQETYRNTITAIQDSTRQSAQNGQIALWVLAVLVVVGVFTSFDIARPIQALIGGIVAFENHTFRPALLETYAQRVDDLGQLSQAVSSMAQSISEANQLKEKFLLAAQRFVPSQYLEFLGKEDITKVKLGDNISATMAVMFSDIRGFTSMSEHMTAQENFDFVNEYLKLVSPIIQKYEGFIVKFLGDGMMAIFPYGVEDAVKAGVEKELAVQEFNKGLKARGLGSITVGIGIHTGDMMVGMIGEELRMQGDAFSDNVNLTSRIEGLNKFYGTSMIISEDTLKELPKTVNLKMRYLGKAIVKGRITPLGMYEIYHGMSPEVIELRDTIKADFETGVRLYAEGKFIDAAQCFEKVLACDASDKTARYYLESCADLASQPKPEGWTGAIVMDSK